MSYKIGPFMASVAIDDDKNVFVDITHAWDPYVDIYSVSTNLNISECGPDGISPDLERDTLRSWLTAGTDPDGLIDDLKKAGF